MKPIHNLFAIATIGLLTISSCTQDEITPTPEQGKGTPVNFTMGVNALTRTTTTDLATVFDEGDQVGIFAFSQSDNQANVAYTKSGDVWNGGINIIEGQSYSYYAYYPYNSSVRTASAATFNVIADQSAGFSTSDVLIAQNTTAGTATDVNLAFSHAFAMVQVTVQSANVTLDNATVSLRNVKNSATINLTEADPTITVGETTEDVIMHLESSTSVTNNHTNVYRAIVPAQEVAADAVILTIDNTGSGNWKFAHNAAFSFVQGGILRMTVTVGDEPQTTTQPITIGDMSIDGWTDDSEPIEGEGTENTDPFESLTLPFSSATTPVALGNYSADKITDELVAPGKWFQREAAANQTLGVGTTVTFGDANITVERGDLAAQSEDGTTKAVNGWNNSSFGYRLAGNFSNSTVYHLSFTVNNPGTANAAIGALIRTSDDSNAFAIANNTGIRMGKTIQTNTIDAGATNDINIYIDFSKKSTTANANNNNIAESEAEAAGTEKPNQYFVDANTEDLSSISIYFYNNTNNSELVLSNIKLEATELTASPAAATTE